MTPSYEQNLHNLGYTLEPLADLRQGRFMRAVRTGSLVYTAGHIPSFGGEAIRGQVGGDLTVEQGYAAARLATLAALQSVKSLVGSLDSVVQMVKVLGLVNAAPGFADTPAVMHGCSDLLHAVFGDAGRHARSAIGVIVPHNYAVEVELIVEVS